MIRWSLGTCCSASANRVGDWSEKEAEQARKNKYQTSPKKKTHTHKIRIQPLWLLLPRTKCDMILWRCPLCCHCEEWATFIWLLNRNETAIRAKSWDNSECNECMVICKTTETIVVAIKIVTMNIFQSDVHTVGFVCWKSGICNGHRAEKNKKKNRLLEVLRLMDANDSQIEI